MPGVWHKAVVFPTEGMVAGPGCSKGVDAEGEGIEFVGNVKGCQRGNSSAQRVPSQHYPGNRKAGRVRVMKAQDCLIVRLAQLMKQASMEYEDSGRKKENLKLVQLELEGTRR